LNLIENDRAINEPSKKAGGVNRGKIAFERIVKTDVVDLLPRLMSEKGGLARLARACDQDGRKASKGLLQGWGELTLLVHG
jgi:hypothetical protein